MLLRHPRRWSMFLVFIAGPVLGWLMQDDRGLLFGLIVSSLAVVWFLIEERHLL